MIRKAALPALAVLAIAAAVVFAGCSGGTRDDTPPPRTAVIIDQLALTSPDPAFVWQATATLEAAGYAVDYIPTEQVTVDFYRELPSRGYGLVIVRGHSGFAYRDAASASAATQELRGKGDTFLFTSEPYTEQEYVSDQRARRLSMAFYFDPTGTHGTPDDLGIVWQPRSISYFGIKPGFVASSTRGRFDHAAVILMGCNGLASQALAKAFEAKGAEAVVGWDGLVTAGHTDDATQRLLTHLVSENLPVGTAVAQTAAEAGPDPSYGGKLGVYR